MSEEKEKTRAARRVCELFRGRFSEEVAAKVIEDLGGELQAVDFILNEKEDVVSQYLKKNPEYVEDMRADSKQIASLLENGIEYETRQFACASCKRTWWKKVPTRKQVAKCTKCKVKYDPVPHDKEWGWAKFICQCSNEFHAFGEMGVTESRCYDCQSLVPVAEVLPPRRRIGKRKKSAKPHSCNGENCYNHDSTNYGAAFTMASTNSTHHSQGNTYSYNVTMGPQGPGKNGAKKADSDASGSGASGSGASGGKSKRGSAGAAGNAGTTPVCLHPMSQGQGRRPFCTASKKHISTGSTVASFLSQGSLDTASVAMSTLERIDE